MRDTEHNEELGSDDPHRQVPAWAELMHSVVNHGHETGWDDLSTEKSDPRPGAENHHVQPITQTAPQGLGSRQVEGT